MENSKEDIRTTQDRVEKTEGGFLASLGDIFVDPVKVFHRIDGGLQWWKPFIVIAVVAVVIAVVSMPVNQHAQMLRMQERGMSAEQVQESLVKIEKFNWLGPIFAPITYIILFLISGGIVHLIISIISMNANFKKTFSLIIFCSFITTAEQIVSTITLKLKGVENIESLSDMKPSISLSVFMPELEGFWRAFLDSLSLFQVWFYIIFTIGLAVIFKIGIKKAVIPVIVLWLISLAFQYFAVSMAGG
jgi:hypothetical protein